MNNLPSRYCGSLLGLAAGDALGTTLEFKPPGTFKPITDIIGGGPFQLEAGQWTDDTSMALCLAKSLLECGGFDPGDQMTRYVKWWKDGYLSSTGHCFDIGNTVATALSRFQATGNPLSGLSERHSAGNGSLMRLAAIPLFYRKAPEMAVHYSAESSKTTHATDTSVDACRYFAGLIVGALQGLSKQDLLVPQFTPAGCSWEASPLHPDIQAIANGSYKAKAPPEIKGSGWVVESLEAALWAFHSTSDFWSGALAAVNLGDDADTTGAIFGQLAGAYYGVESIPPAWIAKITDSDKIANFAIQLLAASEQQ